jgi:hypothetical protein
VTKKPNAEQQLNLTTATECDHETQAIPEKPFAFLVHIVVAVPLLKIMLKRSSDLPCEE